jgi:iron complex outermembrane receptor protein
MWLTKGSNQTFTGTTRQAALRFKYDAGLRGHWENGISGEIVYHWVGATTHPLSQRFVDLQTFWVIAPDAYVGSDHLLNLRGAHRFWQEETTDGYRREAEVAV